MARSALTQARTVASRSQVTNGDTQQPIGLLLTLTHTVTVTGRTAASTRSSL